MFPTLNSLLRASLRASQIVIDPTILSLDSKEKGLRGGREKLFLRKGSGLGRA